MEWYYASDRQQKGPVNDEQFAELVRSGVIRAETLVWRPGMSGWLPYGEVFSASQGLVPAVITSSGTPPSGVPSGFKAIEGGREAALHKVKGPAIALMTYAVLSVIFASVGLINAWRHPQRYNEMPGMDPNVAEMAEKFQAPIHLFYAIIVATLAAVVFIGAQRMKELRSHGLATAAAICAMVPCVCPCCLAGIGLGIWALVVLSRPEVKNQFV